MGVVALIFNAAGVLILLGPQLYRANRSRDIDPTTAKLKRPAIPGTVTPAYHPIWVYVIGCPHVQSRIRRRRQVEVPARQISEYIAIARTGLIASTRRIVDRVEIPVLTVSRPSTASAVAVVPDIIPYNVAEPRFDVDTTPHPSKIHERVVVDEDVVPRIIVTGVMADKDGRRHSLTRPTWAASTGQISRTVPQRVAVHLAPRPYATVQARDQSRRALGILNGIIAEPEIRSRGHRHHLAVIPWTTGISCDVAVIDDEIFPVPAHQEDRAVGVVQRTKLEGNVAIAGQTINHVRARVARIPSAALHIDILKREIVSASP